ncbi:MAG TPA: phosphoribosylformylglycinamidine synthase subunit PurS, partial [Elusimicrobiota bacterium]|nr:phosphoribosylformylglycinamidine synthase subunit PurS [Elusimicrobiota bacterium]
MSANNRNGHHGAASTYVVEVAPRFGHADAAGAALLAQLPSLGVAGVREVRVSALYEITGRLTPSQMHQ